MAVITQHALQSMRQVVLQAAAQSGGVCTRFREIILTYLRTDKHFSSDGHGGPQPMGGGAIGKGKGGKKADGKKGEAKNVEAKAARTTATTALARVRVRVPRSLMATVTAARSTGTRLSQEKGGQCPESRRTWGLSTSLLFSRLRRRRVLVLWLW